MKGMGNMQKGGGYCFQYGYSGVHTTSLLTKSLPFRWRELGDGSCPWNSPPLACALLLSRRWDGFTEGSAVVPAKRPRPVRPRCHSTTQSTGVSLVVQGLRLHTFTAGSTGLTPGQGTKILQAERHCQKQKQDTIHGCKLEVEAVVFSYRLHLIIHLRNFCFPKMDSGFPRWR